MCRAHVPMIQPRAAETPRVIERSGQRLGLCVARPARPRGDGRSRTNAHHGCDQGRLRRFPRPHRCVVAAARRFRRRRRIRRSLRASRLRSHAVVVAFVAAAIRDQARRTRRAPGPSRPGLASGASDGRSVGTSRQSGRDREKGSRGRGNPRTPAPSNRESRVHPSRCSRRVTRVAGTVRVRT